MFMVWEIVLRGCWSKWEALEIDTEKTKQMIRIGPLLLSNVQLCRFQPLQNSRILIYGSSAHQDCCALLLFDSPYHGWENSPKQKTAKM